MSSAALKRDEYLSEVIALFKGFPLLEGFPEHLVTELANASEIINVPINSQILKQGQINDHLYFLIDGEVGVYVDGGRVSKMQRRGDLLGEMSVISSKSVGATLLSESPVTLVRVDSKIFLAMKGPERDLYLSILYRIYATVLAEKLSTTNQQAKHFEELNIRLTATQQELEEANQTLEKKVEERTMKLEQQNAELMAGKRKMEELLNNKRVLFTKLTEFHSQHLVPLKTFLDDIRQKFPSENSVSEARRVVFDVQKVLGPLSDQYSNEQAMQSKRVLLADSNKKQQVIAKMALGGSGVELDMCSTLADGEQKIKDKDYDLVFLDTSMLELANQIKAKNPNVGLVLMTSDQIPTYLPALKKLSAIPHIVSRDEADRTFTVKNIMTTVTKLLSRDLFGLEKYLSWGVEIQSLSVHSSKQREQLISEVDSYFEKLGVRRANRDRIHTVLEEMLMNAIYDAPTDKAGTPLYNHMSRSNELILKPEEQGIVRFATDGMLIAVSVQDPFGSLKGSTILNYLENNYANSQAMLAPIPGKGGAGRGLHQIVENSDLVVFNVDPGKKTEAIALFNVEVKEATHQNPSFHLFIKS
ncbi:MAG: cyclic nucleotide-binding domain-containing protein [Bdellovibrionales bacterium]